MRDLFMLHCGQHVSCCWETLIEVLAETTPAFERVITLDISVCGRKRSRDPSLLALADIARELNDDLHDQGVSQAVLLGHSIAGVVLPLMAAQAPALFSRMLYLRTAIPLEGQTILQMLGTSRHGADPEHVGWPVDITS
ncbi:alpha/beta fold hydrolase, partial [Pseudomonas aeruginosa]